MYTDCLHLHWNLSNQLHGHDQNLIMDGLHEAAGLDIPYSLLLAPPGALHFPKGGRGGPDYYGNKIIKLCFLIHPSILSI